MSLTNFDDSEVHPSDLLGDYKDYSKIYLSLEPEPSDFIRAFFSMPPISFLKIPEIQHLEDQGVYAIQYSGSLPLYEGVSTNQYPLYIGSASGKKGDSLTARLSQHYSSIDEVAKSQGIWSLSEFSFKVIPLKWMAKAVEDVLRERFDPVWNGSGFGHRPGENHTRVGSEKKPQMSKWDTLYEGRLSVEARAGMAARDKRKEEAKFRIRVRESQKAFNSAKRRIGVTP